MTSETNPGARRALYAFVVIGVISASMLTYQILITRVSALRLFFHFGFLAVSNCLLGIGAAGTLITIYQKQWAQDPRRHIWRFCTLYLVSLVLAYAFMIGVALPANLNLVRLDHFLRFSAFNLVAALPFFFSGAVVGMILTFYSSRVNRLYFTDLLGAGIGCLICPFVLARFGAGGCVMLVVLVAIVASVVARPPPARRAFALGGAACALLALWMIPRLDTLFPVPAKRDIAFTKTYTTRVRTAHEFSRWSANSRIDVVAVPAGRRYMFARGDRALRIPLPESKFIVQDGTAGTFLFNFSEQPEGLRALELSLYSAALTLKSRPRVFVIGVGGGNDVWAAQAAGARYVKGVELNQPILEIHQGMFRRFSQRLLDDPAVELVHGEGRSALMRERGVYDVIQMTGIDTWTGLTSGAYVLAENYLYTREAIEAMFERLADGGVLQITRFAAATEALRLLSNLHAALGELGAGGLQESVICLQTRDNLFAVLLKNGKFESDEIAQMEQFAQAAGIEVVYLPGHTSASADNLPARFILSDDKAGFVRRFPKNIAPTTDDQPYFFNFTRWRDLADELDLETEPPSISQGDPTFILSQLLLSTLLAFGLIALPLGVSEHRRIDTRDAGRFFFYFLGLGLGFIAIEIAMLQKLTLFLGHPLYSITVTLFSILVFAGMGSLGSERWFEGSRRREWMVPAGITVTLGLFVLASPILVSRFIGQPLAVRVALTVAALAPTAFLLGVPLAYGIRLLRRMNPSLIPWAWAVNGCFSVVGSILTVVVSMNLGFNVVLWGAIAVYWIAFLALPGAAGARWGVGRIAPRP